MLFRNVFNLCDWGTFISHIWTFAKTLDSTKLFVEIRDILGIVEYYVEKEQFAEQIKAAVIFVFKDFSDF